MRLTVPGQTIHKQPANKQDPRYGGLLVETRGFSPTIRNRVLDTLHGTWSAETDPGDFHHRPCNEKGSIVQHRPDHVAAHFCQ